MNGKVLSRAGVAVAACTSVAVTVATIMAGGPFDRLDWKRFDRAYYVDPGLDLDTDGDGAPDVIDNCLLVPNADQLNIDAGNAALHRPGADAFGDGCDDDIDGDGYANAQEIAHGKSPAAYCAIMRADVDGDAAVTILDMTVLAGEFLDQIPPAPERHKQDADNAITILDLTKMANLFLQNVSVCP